MVLRLQDPKIVYLQFLTFWKQKTLRSSTEPSSCYFCGLQDIRGYPLQLFCGPGVAYTGCSFSSKLLPAEKPRLFPRDKTQTVTSTNATECCITHCLTQLKAGVLNTIGTVCYFFTFNALSPVIFPIRNATI